MIENKMSFYELPVTADYVKTFDKRVYKVVGLFGVEEETGECTGLGEIYYRVRTAIDDKKQIIAKRRNKNDELEKVKSRRVIS